MNMNTSYLKKSEQLARFYPKSRLVQVAIKAEEDHSKTLKKNIFGCFKLDTPKISHTQAMDRK